jgi:hypothetical protein
MGRARVAAVVLLALLPACLRVPAEVRAEFTPERCAADHYSRTVPPAECAPSAANGRTPR